MVGAVGGVGMTSSSSMVIKGTLDTVGIESGFRRIETGFSQVEGKVKGFTSDLTRMGTAAGGVVKAFGAMALTGAGALTALASQAPAVAPAMARINVEMGKLSRTAGEILQPAFNMAADAMTGLSNWLSENRVPISATTDKILEFAGSISNILTPAFDGVSQWITDNPDIFGNLTAGLVLTGGALAGITVIGGLLTKLGATTVAAGVTGALTAVAGIIAGGAVGWTAGNLIGNATYEGNQEAIDQFLTSERGAPLAQGGLFLQDLFTGGNMREQFINQLRTERSDLSDSEFNRRYTLMGWWDSLWR